VADPGIWNWRGGFPLPFPSLLFPSSSPFPLFCTLPLPYSLPPLSLPRPLPLLEVGLLNPARGFGECCKLPSRVWDKAPAIVEFGAF